MLIIDLPVGRALTQRMGYWDSETQKFHFDTYAPFEDASLQALVFVWLQKDQIGLTEDQAGTAIQDALERMRAFLKRQHRQSAVQGIRSCAYYRNLFAKQIAEKQAAGVEIPEGLQGVYEAHRDGLSKALAKLRAMEDVEG